MPRSLLIPCPVALLALVFVPTWSKAGESTSPRAHWAWSPPRRPAVPVVKDAGWCRTPIDSFILSRLEAAGIAPAAPAAPEALLRRLTFDLIGLPPTPEQVDAFRRASAAKPQAAVEALVDELLASSAYGERWGRHWLDLARYAESNGYEFDEVRPNAWRFRDYVVRSFNANKPFDRFVKEQLAGDELFPADPDSLIATGFNLLGPDMTDAASQAQRRQNTLNDMTDTAGLAFLGLTLACARCHDHKFEPLPQTDYYRLQAFFTPSAFRYDLSIANAERRKADAQAQRDYGALVKPARDLIATLEEPYRRRLYEERFAKLSDEARAAHKIDPAKRNAPQQEIVEKTGRLLVVSVQEVEKALSPDDKARRLSLLKEIEKFDARKPAAPPVAMGLQTAPTPAKTFLLVRGELGHPAEEVFAGFPAVVAPDRKPVSASSRRSVLADWVASRDNPLTARVFVNRVWQHHFGYGLVRTPSDFGVHGEPPTHPELLDWLAVEYVESGWDIKRLHRLILSSAVYQQSARPSPEALARDPDNRLLARMSRVRLEGEIIRDTLLSIGGRLNRTVGGPSVYPPLPPEAQQASKGWKASADARDHVRRSVYISARRNLRFPFLEAFDLPDSNLSCPRRERSTTAPQALALLNSGDVTEAAQALTARLERESATADGRVRLAYQYTLGRNPTDAEMRLARAFLADSPLSELCRALFNLNEFVYLD